MSVRCDVSISPARDADPQPKDDVLVDIPEYETYSLLSLYQVLNSVRADLYPDVYEALEREIRRRVPDSVTELEDCYFVLDKDKHPEYEALLRSQIAQLGGFQRARIEPITEENRYRTFWRRFWAYFFDAVVIVVPLGGGAIVAEKTGLVESTMSPALQLSFQFVAVAYFITLHAGCGQTLGKMITGIAVFDVSESRALNWLQAAARDFVPLLLVVLAAVYVFSFGVVPKDAEVTGLPGVVQKAVVFIVPLWALVEIATMLFNRKCRAVHDFIAKTVVVRVAN